MRRLAAAVLAAVAGLFLLSAQLISASPALHHWLHDDATQPNHQCAVALIQKGLGEAPHPQIQVITPPAVVIVTLGCDPQSLPTATDHVQPPGRAPPRV